MCFSGDGRDTAETEARYIRMMALEIVAGLPEDYHRARVILDDAIRVLDRELAPEALSQGDAARGSLGAVN